MIAEILGWVATFFRGGGMLVKDANKVKQWVTIGNICWIINGILTHNIPLVVCNAFCVAVLCIDVLRNYFKKHSCI